MQYAQLKNLLAHQTELISKIALETDLLACLNDIAVHIETLIGNSAKASIFLLENRHLHLSAAPSLTNEYCQLVDNILVTPDTNPCTAAAYSEKQVIIPDLENTPFCDKFVRLSLLNQLKACWATPIFSSSNEILGVFTLYFSEVKYPKETHLEVIQYFTHLTSLALEKHQLLQAQEQHRRQAERLALYDMLTDLPNRRLLMDHTKKIIRQVKSSQLYGALIYIDLNGFKRINDSLGHHVGDELLIAVSKRLQSAMRKTDTISRIGGDEFVVLIENLQPSAHAIEEDANRVACRILKDLEHHFELSGGMYRIGASIGIAIIDQYDTDPVEVLKFADAAMYTAKKHHQKNICFHNIEIQKILDTRLAIENEINHALKNMAFHAFYQPQVDLNGKLIAAEALIRWQHPDKGLIYPNDFISVAENMGVINQMQETMLIEICQTLKLMEKNKSLHKNFRISINISPSQLKHNSLPKILMKTLNTFALSPEYFMLEITEEMLIQEIDKTVCILNELRRLGFKISIDDFGTGYSSLAYLNTLPVNEIKIDKSFMTTLTKEPSSHGIIDSVISLSKHFNFDVIAEGIEDVKQFDVIKQKEVKGLQGYLFAKPMNQIEFIDWVNAA